MEIDPLELFIQFPNARGKFPGSRKRMPETCAGTTIRRKS